MSERQEKKRRYNLRLMWIADFDKWLNRELHQIVSTSEEEQICEARG